MPRRNAAAKKGKHRLLTPEMEEETEQEQEAEQEAQQQQCEVLGEVVPEVAKKRHKADPVTKIPATLNPPFPRMLPVCLERFHDPFPTDRFYLEYS